uniref:Uncharacterized protein n=1 Tax=Ciona savignyi TaxID=51511 RepID=H2Y6M8_CIOSA
VTLLIILAAFAVPFALYWRKILKEISNRHRINKLPSVNSPAYPLVGHSYMFPRNPDEMYDLITSWLKWVMREAKQKLAVVWLGPVPLVAIVHPDAAEVVLRSSKHMEKSFVYRFLHPWLGTGLLTSGGEKWKQRRRLITPSFHFNILLDFLEVMNEQSTKMLRNLDAAVQSGSKVNVGRAITMCALDIICETAMGRTVNAQSDQESEYVKALYRISDIIQQRQKSPALWWDLAFSKMAMGREHDATIDVLHRFTMNVISDRAQSKTEIKYVMGGSPALNTMHPQDMKRMAFLDVLLRAESEDGRSLSLSDIQEEVDTFMFEGHDTTAAAMTWTIYLIGRHPAIQARIHEELDDVFGGDMGTITNSHLQKLSLLERTIKESLRMFPSVPFIGRVTTEECSVGSHSIPAGTQVAIFIDSLHHNPSVWPDVDRFDPDRFLPENCVGRHPYSFIPFSAGPRNCIGQKFALMEEKVLLTQILRKYSIHSHDEEEDLRKQADLILRSSTPLNISLTPR